MKEELSCGQNQPGSGKVHGGLHGDVDAFKVRPQSGSGIGEAAGCEGVGGEQKTEIVGEERTGSRKTRKDGQTQRRAKSDQRNRQTPAPRQWHESPLDARKPDGAKPGKEEGQPKGKSSEPEFEPQQRQSVFGWSGENHGTTSRDLALSNSSRGFR